MKHLCNSLLHKFRGATTSASWTASRLPKTASGTPKPPFNTDGVVIFWFTRLSPGDCTGRGKPLPTSTAPCPRPSPTSRGTSPKIPTTSIFSPSATMPTSAIWSAAYSTTCASSFSNSASGFAFVGNQYRLAVGDQEFYIDLLFYHLKLRAYVVIDRKRPVGLSITHKTGAQKKPEFDVGKSGHAAPHNGISRRRILASSEIPAQSGDFR
jgi:YhcG PDDEXK nuclease domain